LQYHKIITQKKKKKNGQANNYIWTISVMDMHILKAVVIACMWIVYFSLVGFQRFTRDGDMNSIN